MPTVAVAVVGERQDRLAVQLLELVADRAHEHDVGVQAVLAVADDDGAGLLLDRRRLRGGRRALLGVVEGDHEDRDERERDDDADAHPDREPVRAA